MSDTTQARPQAPTDRLNELKSRLERARQVRRLFLFAGLGGTALLASMIALTFTSYSRYVMFLFRVDSIFAPLFFVNIGLMPLLMLVATPLLPIRSLEYQIQEIEDENDLQSRSTASHEQKAYKLLRIQQGQLTRFLSVILTQSKTIFFVGLFAMLVGVGVILFAIHEAKGADGTEKWVVGVLGAIGAILTNFVAAIYIRMFGDIGGAVKDAVSMLARSSNVNFANVMASKIKDDDTSRNVAYKELAVAIISKT